MATEDSTTENTFWGLEEIKRRCTRCKVLKRIEEFYLCVQWRTGKKVRKRYCRDCSRATVVEWSKNNSERLASNKRQANLRANYGLTPQEYAEMFAQQGGVCAICKKPETRRLRSGKLRNLTVDHNHTTNAVRKLLCAICNCMIGYAQEEPARLRAGAEYLESFA